MSPNLPGMFSANRLKVQLRLAVNRLKLLQQKKASLNASQRKELSLLLDAGKVDSARVRVEHVIREDLTMEALEVLELYCELLLARFGLIEGMAACDAGIQEAVHTLIYAAPRVDVKELHVVRDLLAAKYGKDFAQSALENRADVVNRRVIQKLKVQTPDRALVNLYLVEIAKAYKVKWEPEPEPDDAAAAYGAGAADVRTDSTGSYPIYDASDVGFTPSRDYPVNPNVRIPAGSAPAGPPGTVHPPHYIMGPAASPPPQQQQQQQQQVIVPTHYMDGTPIPANHAVQYVSHPHHPHQYYQPPPVQQQQQFVPMPMPMPPPQPMGAPPGYLADGAASLGVPQPRGGGGPVNPAALPLPPSPAMSILPGGSGAPDMPSAPSASATLQGGTLTSDALAAAKGDEPSLDFPSIPTGSPSKGKKAADADSPDAAGVGGMTSGDGVPDFDELARRFEALKRRK
ncbi:Vacuolar protein sorting-associated protein ist1 [Blastocladiella emersonii ATCC 22665]|nr:Vacuolar protein sorting-associated protein ist1 [Blastocladiella emersonii ATCC 22665]